MARTSWRTLVTCTANQMADGACVQFSMTQGGPYDLTAVVASHRAGLNAYTTSPASNPGISYWVVGDTGFPDYLHYAPNKAWMWAK